MAKSLFTSVMSKNTIMPKKQLWGNSFRGKTVVTMIYGNGSIWLHDHRADIAGVIFQIVEALIDLFCIEWNGL